MHYTQLGHSGLTVSRVCLGTMTWGTQNNEKEAHDQINCALAHGITFIDTAELYATPPTADTYGKTESIIGNWLSANPSRRAELVLATKIAGNGLPYIRNASNITGNAIMAAVDASLRRLKTDYIDLYQLHWPNRPSPHFAKHHPGHLCFTQIDTQAESAQSLEILQAIDACIKAGKVRYFGLSNDTPWGINEYLRLSEQHNLARATAIQNEFNLLHTKDWPYVIENCVRAQIAYLPWSPLAAGALTGKYIDGARPPGSRWCHAQRHGLFRDTLASNQAIKAYRDIAHQHNLTPAQLALAWCNQVDGVTSTIIGATHLEQLQENIAAFDTTLSDAALQKINAVLRQYPTPF